MMDGWFLGLHPAEPYSFWGAVALLGVVAGMFLLLFLGAFVASIWDGRRSEPIFRETGAAISYGGGSTPVLIPDEEAAFINYATEVGGDYLMRRYADARIVVTKVDNWTIVAEGGSEGRPSVMRALYSSLDGFQFKVATRWGLHDLMARIFGSMDIDVGDPQLHKHYSVESNDEDMVRRLLTNQTFRDLWLRCVQPAGSHNVINRFRTKQSKHEIHVELRGFWGLSFVHDLLVHTLHELADMGSASREPVALREQSIFASSSYPIAVVNDKSAGGSPLGGGWKPAEEQHVQRGSDLGDKRKWREAILEFDRALSLNPSQANAHAHRGFAYAKLGQRDEAIADLERAKALSDDPDIVAELEAAIKAIREPR